jgi:WD40 repeat protein
MNMNMNKKEIIEMEVVMSDIADAKEKVEKTIRYWQTLLDELDRRAKEYSDLLSAMKAKEEEDRMRRDSVESMMKLNLRGQVFDTTKHTILNGDSTFFSVLLSSIIWELDGNGEIFIDRCGNGFDRVLDYMSTGVLSTEGLNRYDEDCVYAKLVYFKIPHKAKWDYSIASQIENLNLKVCLQLLDGRICGSTSDYGIVCIYNMDTNVIETIMKGHTKYVVDVIQLEDGRLCSCSYDRSIKLWDIGSGVCNLTIDGHTSGVTCVIQLLDGRLCSGSEDHTVKIWSKDSGVCELAVNAGDSIFRIAQLRDGRICCGDYGGNLKIWNIATGVCEMTLRGHTDIIRAIVVIDELRICSCSCDKTIRIWNVSGGLCERTLEGHGGYVWDMVLLLDGRLCSVSVDSSAKIWTIETGVCDLTVHVSSTLLYKVIQLNDGRLVVSDTSRLVYIIGA